ncbi:T-box transcription factor TBX15-like [Gigantopelta aegis]|uniref:T-box transcription factor TBX15-like n=1 Tax=Gigantopelta aegis TaxID=1735272 RepID=UPI001B88B238|nr:T-box transcription factor TBX15-like [Gigantopelta aegis]
MTASLEHRHTTSHTMLSPKAKAFSVEQLLRRPLEEDVAKEKKSSDLFHIPRGDDRMGEVRVELCHGDLWESFYRLGTEMIITKSGRRMFPPLRLRVLGTEPGARYTISLNFVNIIWQSCLIFSSKWIVSGNGEALADGHRYGHPDSPFSGHSLINQIISFDKVKLTNNQSRKPGQVRNSLMCMSSMQRFQPQIHVEKLETDNSVISHTVVSFPQTTFMAVTAYQNQEITRLKIAKNPFAKGFREAGKNRQYV